MSLKRSILGLLFLSTGAMPLLSKSIDISGFEIKGSMEAAQELKSTLERTGGYTGGGSGTIQIVDDEALPIETMKVTIRDDNITIAGNPAKWAVYEFLGRKIGVRYLWPGHLGTYVPKMSKVIIDDQSFEFRPELLRRDFRQKKGDLLLEWCDKHYLSKKRNLPGIRWGHAQHDWFEKYSKSMPGLFAVNPKGNSKPWNGKADRAKLRIGSPKVVDMVIKEWIEAGKPNGICLSPTDSAGYDTSPESMALDPVEYDKELVWTGKVNLTDRHVKYWNTVYEKVKRLNPDVKVGVYAYGAYREPPKTLKLAPNAFHVQVVPTWFEEDKRIWHGWSEQAEAMYLRPNWPFNGYSAPYFQLQKMGDWISFAYKHKMKGFDCDSITPFFGMRGPFYYMIARMMAHPEMNPQDVLAEFYSGFGAAADDVKAHYDYWEKYSDTLGMPVTAGGPVGGDPEGPYMRMVKEYKFTTQPLAGSMLMMPILFKDDVVDPAIQILTKALPKVEGEDRARLQFLIDAYEPFKLQRELVGIYIEIMYKSKNLSLLPKMRAKEKEFVEAHNRVYKGVNEVRSGLNKWLNTGLQERGLDNKSLEGM
jgi:hypothetical protein